MKSVIFLIISLSFIFPQLEGKNESDSKVSISGDARIRPRMDIKNYVDDKITMDLYYLYRARLNFNVDIGKGWFLKTKIGTNNSSALVKMGVDETYNTETDSTVVFTEGFTNGPGNPNSARPQVDFLNLYYGIKKDNFGFWGGAIPLPHNPGLDIHFYPDKIMDVPWATWNNESTTGFAGYIYKFNWFISIDGNKTERISYTDIEKGLDEKNIDPFTFGFDFSMKWNDIIDNIHPRGMFSIANMNKPWPMSFGLDINFSSLFGIKPVISYHYATQFIEKKSRYDITHLRIKLDRKIGPGELTLLSDIASHIDKTHENGEYKTDYFYIWLDYKYQLFNSNSGSFSIKPTIRILDKKSIDDRFNRIKFELTTEIKFK